MASMTFLINDTSTGGSTPTAEVTITENGDGTLSFEVTQLAAAGAYIGDLRGFFFDILESTLTGLAVTQFKGFNAAGTQILSSTTEVQIGNDSVVDLGNGATMSGLT